MQVTRQPEFRTEAQTSSDMFKNVKATLEMIDFGVSIDMSLFHKGQSFRHKFEKVDSRCPEMLDDKPWTYEVRILLLFFFCNLAFWPKFHNFVQKL